jgi:hypothetical protein
MLGEGHPDNFKLELLGVLRHEKPQKVGVQLLGVSSFGGFFYELDNSVTKCS